MKNFVANKRGAVLSDNFLTFLRKPTSGLKKRIFTKSISTQITNAKYLISCFILEAQRNEIRAEGSSPVGLKIRFEKRIYLMLVVQLDRTPDFGSGS
jgi:hypothetical protein